ncbi:MAG: hypothetical protein J6D47_04730 [Peptostreptococcaceae bacterium]|nr:hypothetical protein [Peptostreptococcaceae bacterium]
MKNLLVLGIVLSCTLFTFGCSKEEVNKTDITNETEVVADNTNSMNDDLKFYLPERIYMVTKSTLEGYLEIIDSSNGEDDASTIGSLSVYTKTIKTNIENMNELYPNDPYAKELSNIMNPCIESLDKILNHVEDIERISEEDIEICLNTIYDTQDKINSKISELEID